MLKSPLIVPRGGMLCSLAFGILSAVGSGGFSFTAGAISVILVIVTLIALWVYADVHNVHEREALQFSWPIFLVSTVIMVTAVALDFVALGIAFGILSFMMGAVTVITGTIVYKDWVEKTAFEKDE